MDSAEVTRRLVEMECGRVRGRRVVVVSGIAAGGTALVRRCLDHGAAAVLLVGMSAGTGELPSSDEARVVLSGAPAFTTMADELAVTQTFVDDPPTEVRDAVHEFDPSGDAVVITTSFATLGRYLDRDTWGGRPARFTALEDKTLSRGIWWAAGVDHSPEEVVDCTWESLSESTSRLDHGAGVVWSADASHGWNGGADRVRWVRDDLERRAAFDELRSVADRVRVQPFLDGVPCSIHGVVAPDGVAVLRPVELLVLRRVGGTQLVYCGISTTWDPPGHRREQMRDAARRVGAWLAEEHDYRGAFGLDGVLTAQGWLPTELNPRFSGGLQTIAKGVPDLPLATAHQALLRGGDLGVTAADLEAVLLPAADEHRFGSAYTASRQRAETTRSVRLAGWQPVDEGGDATLEQGPSPHGSLVRWRPDAPTGRLAHHAAEAMALADQLWDTGIGPLEAAPEA